MKTNRLLMVLAIVALLGLGGCAKKKGASSAADAGAGSGSGSGSSGSFSSADLSSFTPENVIENLNMINIYFDYDQSALKDQDRKFLKVLSEALKMEKNKGLNLKVEGHCDERGSNEYNLALGERRARSVNDYLNNLGVAKKRLDVVSFGEEKPAEMGANESAWAKNRRVHFEANK